MELSKGQKIKIMFGGTMIEAEVVSVQDGVIVVK